MLCTWHAERQVLLASAVSTVFMHLSPYSGLLSSFKCISLFLSGVLVVEAIALTAAVVVGLTAYTFYAMRKGYEFG